MTITAAAAATQTLWQTAFECVGNLSETASVRTHQSLVHTQARAQFIDLQVAYQHPRERASAQPTATNRHTNERTHAARATSLASLLMLDTTATTTHTRHMREKKINLTIAPVRSFIFTQ